MDERDEVLRMNCNDFELEVLSLARQDLMDAAARKLCLDHAETCTRCARRFAEERALQAAIRSVVAAVATAETPARIEQALVAAFRDHVQSSVRISSVRPGNRARWRGQFAAAAAMILVMISVMGLYRRHSPPPPRVRDAETIKTAVGVMPNSINGNSTSEPTTAQRITKPPALARMRQRGLRHASVPSEQATDFFPLMAGVDLNSLETLGMVRVELPASELRSFGFPIAVELASEPVKADVILGYDGQARAIRFIR
jgi:hypothetical protein